MADIDFKLNATPTGLFDIGLNLDGDFEMDQSYDTAIVVSIFTDARADESEIAESSNRRGWAGNEATPGREMGGKVWLWVTNRNTPAVRRGLASALDDCLAWFVTDGLLDEAPSAKSFKVNAGALGVNVGIPRPGSTVDNRSFEAWERTGVNFGN